MFNFGFLEIILILMIGLLIVGPKRLPALTAESIKWIKRIKNPVHTLQTNLVKQLEFGGEKKSKIQTAELEQLKDEEDKQIKTDE